MPNTVMITTGYTSLLNTTGILFLGCALHSINRGTNISRSILNTNIVILGFGYNRKLHIPFNSILCDIVAVLNDIQT